MTAELLARYSETDVPTLAQILVESGMFDQERAEVMAADMIPEELPVTSTERS